jgi:hypothetical protein
MEIFHRNSIKKLFLYSFVLSVIFSSLMGIIALLADQLGQMEQKIILTTISIALSSVLGLACGAYLEKANTRRLPIVGIFLAIGAAVLVIFGIWTDQDSVHYWKPTVSCSIAAVAVAHISLLSIFNLARRFTISIPIAYIVILGLAGILISIILLEIDNEEIMRLVGVVGIMVAAISIIIPVFHRLSKGEFIKAARVDIRSIDSEIEVLKIKIVALELKKNELESHEQASSNDPSIDCSA